MYEGMKLTKELIPLLCSSQFLKKHLLIGLNNKNYSFQGNPGLAKQKILSIFHHVCNVHEFPALEDFQKCQHEAVLEERPWILAGKYKIQPI